MAKQLPKISFLILWIIILIFSIIITTKTAKFLSQNNEFSNYTNFYSMKMSLTLAIFTIILFLISLYFYKKQDGENSEDSSMFVTQAISYLHDVDITKSEKSNLILILSCLCGLLSILMVIASCLILINIQSFDLDLKSAMYSKSEEFYELQQNYNCCGLSAYTDWLKVPHNNFRFHKSCCKEEFIETGNCTAGLDRMYTLYLVAEPDENLLKVVNLEGCNKFVVSSMKEIMLFDIILVVVLLVQVMVSAWFYKSIN